MEKRVLLAIVLSIAVMYGYTLIFPQPKQPVPVTRQQNVPPLPAASTSSMAAVAPVAASMPVASQQTARDVTIDTDVYHAVISTFNGSLKSLSLKKYKDVAGPGGKEIVLFQENDPRSFTVASDFSSFSVDGAVIYAASTDSLQVSGSESKSLELTATTASGLQIRKIYRFSGNGYAIDLDQELANRSAAPLTGSAQIILRNKSQKPKEDAGRYEVFGPVTFTDAGVVFDKLTDLVKAPKPYTLPVKWSGFGDKYFLNAVLAKNSSIASLTLTDANGYLEQRFAAPKLSLNPGQAAMVSYSLYFGPKDLDILKAQGTQLEQAIDLGWFSAIAKPMLHSLKLFYRYLHNYGLAIILITVILKIFFFPLTHKSYKSMKEMQKIQPKMQQLKEKYKDDRDGLNRAVMELYKTHKVNPLGGCLPMLVQIPVFFGLYKALMFSIELRHAPFYFWLQDLSAKDPYYVTPVIMGATMFIQQKMTPTNMDPIQAKMMLALPVVFTFMFLNFPSGLVLYWLVNNILTIAQQAYINKSLKEA
jgi:YidC/Oxa1 family membrane protein insertase